MTTQRKTRYFMTETLLGKMIDNRRTFAIISHPDAGKTTLTEKLLLYGGAIRLAGTVKSRKSNKHATSDWMEIEKQRGISVTSSAMQFEYDGYCVNILDTPGHQDFSEDTYRTLVAADSAVMLIDGAKGIEPQTIKLFQVCKMRGIPIFTFVNKMDRAAKDPFEIMEDLENILGIPATPINWPIGINGDFAGVYHRDIDKIEVYSQSDTHGANKVERLFYDKDNEEVWEKYGEHLRDQLLDEIELLDGAGDDFDLEKVLAGELTPLFFGSAMNNFGVEFFLEKFLEFTPPPQPRNSDIGIINPTDEQFTAFVFKIQANMNPAHRDRLAFIRICSGKFTKGMEVTNVQLNKKIKLTQPQQFMAQDRQGVETAWPGDIIGIFDPGVFNLGDTIVSGKRIFKYEGIPLFAPENFMRVAPIESLRRKQFIKGISQLSEEGAIQTFIRMDVGREELVVGVVGILQFDVLKFRMEFEYNVELTMESLPYKFVRWIMPFDVDVSTLTLSSSTILARDRVNRAVILFQNSWSINWALDNNPDIKLTDTAPRLSLNS